MADLVELGSGVTGLTAALTVSLIGLGDLTFTAATTSVTDE